MCESLRWALWGQRLHDLERELEESRTVEVLVIGDEGSASSSERVPKSSLQPPPAPPTSEKRKAPPPPHHSTLAALQDLSRPAVEVKREFARVATELDRRICCSVCLDEERNCVFLPCLHLATCAQCAKTIADTTGQCPFCKETIKSTLVGIVQV